MNDQISNTRKLDTSFNHLIRLAVREAVDAGMNGQEILELTQRLIREQKENTNHDSIGH